MIPRRVHGQFFETRRDRVGRIGKACRHHCARAAGHGLQVALALLAAIVLSPASALAAGSISGTVTQLIGGAPIQNVRVNANPTTPGGTFGTTLTSATGSYTISGLADGSYKIQAQAEPGHTDHLATSWYPGQLDWADASPVAVSGGGSVIGIDFALSGVAGGLSGTIVDGANANLPIPNATISITTDAGDSVLWVNTDAFGVFNSALRLAPGDYTFQVTSTGTVVGVAHLWAGGTNHALAAGTATFPVSDGGIFDTGILILTVGRKITGQVTDASTLGAIPGAGINVHDDATDAFVAGTFLTDGGGNFDTGAILPEGSYTINAFATGFVTEWWDNRLFSGQADPITLSGGDATGKNFALTPGGSITGAVRDGGAVGIGGVTVTAFSTAPGIAGTSTTTASDGTYTLAGLLTGTYKLQALPSGVPPVGGQSFALQWYSGRSDSPTADSVGVTAPGTTSNKNFVLALGAGSISGTVMSGADPVPFADVQIFRANGNYVMSVRASGSGAFNTGRVLPPGSYLVRAGPSFGTSGFGTLYYPGVIGYPNATPVVISAGNDDKSANFDLPVAGGIVGTITCAAVGPGCPSVGTPIAGAQVNIDDFSTGTFVAGTFFTDATGHFNSGRILAPGNYKVQVVASGFVEQWAFNKPDLNSADPVAVSSSLDTDASLALAIAGSISGTVFCAPFSGPGCDASGRLAGATIKVDLQHGGNFRQAVTAGDGTYTVTDITPAPNYKVQAVAPGFATRFYNGQTSALAPDLVSVAGGVTTPGINFTLPAGAGGISGNITRQSNGQPIPNAGSVCLNLASNGGFVLCVGTDGSGHYDTGLTLGAGDYKVASPIVPGLVHFYYNAKPSFNTADPVTVTNGSTVTNVNFSLPAGGGITGHVCTGGTGLSCSGGGATPIAGASVSILDAVTGDFISGFSTDGTGAYQTGQMLDPSKTYKVRANAGGYLTEFFNVGGSVPTIGQATPIGVVAGTDQTGTDVVLPVGTGISGTVRRSDTSAPLSGAAVEIYDAGTGAFVLGPSGNTPGLTTGGTGQYDTGVALPPGNYKIRAHESGFQDRFYPSSADFASATPVTTTSGTASGKDISLPPNPPPSLTLRDSFDGATLDQTLWAGGNLEFVRQITAGKADLRLTTANTNLNNGLPFIDETVNPFADFSIQADAALTAVDLAGMQTRARIQFGFFNVNAGSPVPGDETGDVTVEYALQHTGSIYRVYIEVFRCDDALCNNGVDLFFTTSAFDPGALGSTHTMSVSWAAATKTMTFGFDAQTPVSFVIPTGTFPIARSVNVPFKLLSLRVRAVSDPPTGKSGSASATFDNVMVNGALYDDFSSAVPDPTKLDPAKWKAIELVRQIGGGVFTSSVRRVGANGSNNMNLLNANAVTTMQADITVTAVQNTMATPNARLVGGFYNNGAGSPGDPTGDVRAGVGILHDGANQRGHFFVVRCLNASCNLPGEVETLVADDTTFGVVDPGSTHRVSLEWDPVAHVFTFGFDGVTHTMAPTGFPGYEFVNGTPNVPFKALATRVTNIGSPGEGGFVTATFDNFYAGNFVSGRVTTGDGVTALPGSTVTAYASGAPFGPPAITAADGTYTLVDVPAGTYQIGAHAAGYIDRFYRGKSSLATADPVTVTTGGAAVGVNIAQTIAGAGTTSRLAADTPPPLIVTPGSTQILGPILISENGVGALAQNGQIVLTLPAGLTFAGTPVVSTVVGNELTAAFVSVGGSAFTFKIASASTNNAGRLQVSGLVVAVGALFGPGDVSVTISNGSPSAGVTGAAITVATAVAAPGPPTIDGSVTASAGGGSTGQVVDVLGVNFAPGDFICIGTFAAGVCTPPAGLTVGVTTFVSPTELSVAVGVAAGAPGGTFAINVVRGGSAATLADAFVINPAPTVAATDRQGTAAALFQNVPHQLMTITGAGFQPPTTSPIQVLFPPGSGITAAANTVEQLSATAITVVVDVGDLGLAGASTTTVAPVTVVNPDGGVSPASAGAFVTVKVAPPDAPVGLGAPKSSGSASTVTTPTITSLNPARGLLGSALTIMGSNFGTTPAANAVTFAGVNGTRVAATVTSASGGAVGVTVPPQAVDGPVTVSVGGVLSIANPSTAGNFTVADPRLSTASPAGIPQGSVGLPLVLAGSKLVAGATVTFSPAGGITTGGAVVAPDGTSLTVPVTVPAGEPTGFRSVTVTNHPDNGTATLNNAVEIQVPAAGVLVLSLLNGANDVTGTFLPSVGVTVTLDASGHCTAKTLTPVAVKLQAQFVGGVAPPSVTFTLDSSALPGTATNEDCEPSGTPTKDWSVTAVGDPAPAVPGAQQVTVGPSSPNFYQAMLYSFDMGGTVKVTAVATTDSTVKGALLVPPDADGDSLPDAYENTYPGTFSAQNGDQNGNGVLDGQDRFARDGLTNFEKYRGVFLMGPLGGMTGALSGHQRLDPGRRNLFVRGRGWGNDPLMLPGTCGVDPTVGDPTTGTPYDPNDPSTFLALADDSLSVTNPCPAFELGVPGSVPSAFDDPRVGVKVVNVTTSFTATTQLPRKSLADPTKPTLDLLTVVYDGHSCNGAEACDQTTKTGIRQFQFPTLGFSTFGSGSAYGTARVYKRAIDGYFRHRPYQHRTNDPTRVVIAADGRPMLAPIKIVADVNDNGLRDTKEAVDTSGNLLGDTYVGGSANQTLSAMDVNNDGCMELPTVPDPTTILTACDPGSVSGTPSHPSQATKRQVARSVYTHEAGHGVGINIHTTDPNDLMYQYTINWTRENFFSDTAVSLIQIHNKGVQ